MECSSIFLWNKQPEIYYPNPKRGDAPISIVINQGGMGSGKTYAIMQLLLTHCITSPNLRVTVVRRHLTDLRNDAINIALALVDTVPMFKKMVVAFNRSSCFFDFTNGSKMSFKGLDNPEKGKGTKQHYSYISEANNIKLEAFDEIQSRTERVTYIDYNPNARFWAHDLVGKPHVAFFRSTYQHNPFIWERDELGAFVLDDKGQRIGKGLVRNIENRKDDKKWFDVYGLGYTGKTDGLVFTNTQKAHGFPDNAADVTVGIDFGYSRDVTAIVLTGFIGGELFIKELAYQTHMNTLAILAVLDRAVKANYISKDTVIIGDSAAGGDRVIDEIKDAGYKKAKKAIKGAGSIAKGIEFLEGLDSLNVCDSPNVWAEFLSYEYKNSEKKPNEVVDKNNHAMDAIRYATEDKHHLKSEKQYFAINL